MSPTDRKKTYAYTVDEQVSTAPLSSANIALTINRVALKVKDSNAPSTATVERWYMAYLQNGRAQIDIRNGGARCDN